VTPHDAVVPFHMAVRAAAIMAHLLNLVAGLLIGVAELLWRERSGRSGRNGETGGGKTGGGERDQGLVHFGDLLCIGRYDRSIVTPWNLPETV
jgi:hypothetical protein